MKKTLLASAIVASTLGSAAAQADIVITNMSFDTTDYASAGTLTDSGDGNLFSVDTFFGHSWTASQQTGFMDSTGTWNGTSVQGAFDFDADIAAMSNNQRAVGLFFDWNANNDIALLEIFNCAANVCVSEGVSINTGPKQNPTVIFSGTGSAHAPEVPVPAAVWLMGSGLLGLVGVARRRKNKIL